MLKKICEVCGKEESVDIEDNIYFIHLGSRNLGYEEVDEAKEIRYIKKKYHNLQDLKWREVTK